jgi:putative SOS response-associated peptidase YedK
MWAVEIEESIGEHAASKHCPRQEVLHSLLRETEACEVQWGLFFLAKDGSKGMINARDETVRERRASKTLSGREDVSLWRGFRMERRIGMEKVPVIYG